VKWASSVSEKKALEGALEECVSSVRAQLGSAEPHLVVPFVSVAHALHFSKLSDYLNRAFPNALILGSTAHGVIGGNREVEGECCLTLTAAHLPDVALMPFHLEQSELPGPIPALWHAHLDVSPEVQPAFVLLPDPYTTDAKSLMNGFDIAYPKCPKIGGLVSGANHSRGHVLFLGDTMHASGAIGVAMYGDVVMDTIVAQGCRPVGASFRVTRCEDNQVFELDGQPAGAVLERLYSSLSNSDKLLFRVSPMIGLAMDSEKNQHRHGDFLIRNVRGISRKNGSMVVMARVEQEMIVRFHVRDAEASAYDLHEMLSRYQQQYPNDSPAGGLVFSCLGRGSQFFNIADHDITMMQDILGDVSLGGFFCNGEIGPVHGKSYVHGYTSVAGLFRPCQWS